MINSEDLTRRLGQNAEIRIAVEKGGSRGVKMQNIFDHMVACHGKTIDYKNI